MALYIENTMYLSISSVLALLFPQTQALPINNALKNFTIPGFIQISSGSNYKLCTQGCWPAPLFCSSPEGVRLCTNVLFDNCSP